MSSLSYRTKVNFGVTAVVLLISAFFAVLAWDINPDSDEIIGPRFVPVFIVFLMVALGVLISIIALRQDVAGRQANPDINSIHIEEDFGFRDSNVAHVLAVIGCGIVYVVLFVLFGYFLATLFSFFLILYVFDNRQKRTLFVLPIAGTLIYQFVFMGLMGLHDPDGAIFDLKFLTKWLAL